MPDQALVTPSITPEVEMLITKKNILAACPILHEDLKVHAPEDRHLARLGKLLNGLIKRKEIVEHRHIDEIKDDKGKVIRTETTISYSLPQPAVAAA